MKDQDYLILINRLTVEEGCAELDLELAKVFGEARDDAYVDEGHDDPETGHPNFSSPAYDDWLAYERAYCEKHDDLPPDSEYPEEFINGKSPMGYCSRYSRSVDDILRHVPEDADLHLNRFTSGGYSCTVGEISVGALTAPCAVAAALLIHLERIGFTQNE